MKKILVIGATSAIAIACMRRWATEDAAFHLVGRNEDKLRQITDDLLARGKGPTTYTACDLSQLDRYPELFRTCFAAMPAVDICLVAQGTLPDQLECETDAGLTVHEIITNGLGVIACLTYVTSHMEACGAGSIAVISSVAGDRGRQSNYVYGSAKAAVTAFASGLRQRLAKKGIRVITIKPGFVDTPMTRDFKKGALWATANSVAAGITNAIDKEKTVVYLPGFWRIIMFIIRSIPESVFVRLKL